MTNSDYLLKATIKKLGEKLNQTFFEKIEETANAAQGVPEILKNELEILKDEIIQEAKRMENSSEEDELQSQENFKSKAIKKIRDINEQIVILNNKLDY
tara:strand:+ start:1441 stop:1737 length:297 start_codon:yes stop_codon:yes gene_type:complete